MKVGTDGVLLGCWAPLGSTYNPSLQTDPTHPEGSPLLAQRASVTAQESLTSAAPRILDIGSGTGLIALIAAQRHASARIDAIEPDQEACIDAHHNFNASPWRDRLTLHPSTLQHFETEHRYDYILANPPFFTNSLPCPDPGRHAARHTTSLPFEAIWEGVERLLIPRGIFSVILPFQAYEHFDKLALEAGFTPHSLLHVSSTPSALPIRRLVAYRRIAYTETPPQMETLAIREENRIDFTAAYRHLTRDFYLRF